MMDPRAWNPDYNYPSIADWICGHRLDGSPWIQVRYEILQRMAHPDYIATLRTPADYQERDVTYWELHVKRRCDGKPLQWEMGKAPRDAQGRYDFSRGKEMFACVVKEQGRYPRNLKKTFFGDARSGKSPRDSLMEYLQRLLWCMGIREIQLSPLRSTWILLEGPKAMVRRYLAHPVIKANVFIEDRTQEFRRLWIASLRTPTLRVVLCRPEDRLEGRRQQLQQAFLRDVKP